MLHQVLLVAMPKQCYQCCPDAPCDPDRQTVWLEPVPTAYIERVDMIPDIDSNRLWVFVVSNASADGIPLSVEVQP